MSALSEIVLSGKARAIGFSEWTAEQIQGALDLVPPNVKFASSQPQYSMLYRKHEPNVFPLCIEKGIGQIVWSPMAQGVLSGKYKPGAAPPAGSRATSDDGHFMRHFLTEPVLEAVQKLGPIAERAGCGMAQFAVGWVLAQPGITSAIIGARTRPSSTKPSPRGGIEGRSRADRQGRSSAEGRRHMVGTVSTPPGDDVQTSATLCSAMRSLDAFCIRFTTSSG